MILYLTSRYGFLLYVVVYLIGDIPMLDNNVRNDKDCSIGANCYMRRCEDNMLHIKNT